MFSIIFPKNTWSLKSNFPKKSSPSGRNLARRFFSLHSSSLARGCRTAPRLCALSVTPRCHLLWVTHSELFLSKSRAWPRCLDGSDRLQSQAHPGPGHTEGLGKSLLPFSLPGTVGWERMELRWEQELLQVPRTGAANGCISLSTAPAQGFASLQQQNPKPSMPVPPSTALHPSQQPPVAGVTFNPPNQQPLFVFPFCK